MKTSRIKIKLPTLITRDDAEAAMHDLALAVNARRRITTDRDAAVLAINKRCEPELSSIDETIKTKSDALRAWAESNPDQFPKGRKSLDLVAGVLGFRTGTPKLALLSRAFNWDKVLGLLKSLGWIEAVRTKEEVDKEYLLAHWSGSQEEPDRRTHENALRAVGLKVVQDESFFVEPKLTELPTRTTVEAA